MKSDTFVYYWMNQIFMHYRESVILLCSFLSSSANYHLHEPFMQVTFLTGISLISELIGYYTLAQKLATAGLTVRPHWACMGICKIHASF